MAMDVSAPRQARNKKGRAHPEMNVTPLVDVVLVLLIIFMVLTAVLNEHFWLHVPEKDKQAELEPPPRRSQRAAHRGQREPQAGQVQINQDVFPDREFPERLRACWWPGATGASISTPRTACPFERAVEVMDLARGGGAAHIAVVSEKLE